MASLALGPEVVGECHLEHAVAVGVLEESAALDAVDILPPVEVIAHREAHHPLSREVQPLADLVFHACSDGQVEGHPLVLAAIPGGAYSHGDEWCEPSRTPVFLACAVGPEVILKAQVCLCDAMTELIALDGVVRRHIVGRAFDLAHADIQCSGHPRVHAVLGHECSPGLHALQDVAVEIAHVGHQSGACSQFQPVLRLFLGMGGH